MNESEVFQTTRVEWVRMRRVALGAFCGTIYGIILAAGIISYNRNLVRRIVAMVLVTGGFSSITTGVAMTAAYLWDFKYLQPVILKGESIWQNLRTRSTLAKPPAIDQDFINEVLAQYEEKAPDDNQKTERFELQSQESGYFKEGNMSEKVKEKYKNIVRRFNRKYVYIRGRIWRRHDFYLDFMLWTLAIVTIAIVLIAVNERAEQINRIVTEKVTINCALTDSGICRGTDKEIVRPGRRSGYSIIEGILNELSLTLLALITVLNFCGISDWRYLMVRRRRDLLREAEKKLLSAAVMNLDCEVQGFSRDICPEEKVLQKGDFDGLVLLIRRSGSENC